MLITKANTIAYAAAMLLEKTTANFAITIGAEGTLFGYKNTTTIIPSIKISPIDTTGAGDAFVGALLFQLSKMSAIEIENLSLEQWINIIANANKAGARTCEYLGAMEAFKHLNSEIFS